MRQKWKSEMSKQANQWRVAVTINGRTWTWRRDTREEASAIASSIARNGCTLTVGKNGGFDRVGPAMIKRIRVMPPRNVIHQTNDSPGTMSLVDQAE